MKHIIFAFTIFIFSSMASAEITHQVILSKIPLPLSTKHDYYPHSSKLIGLIKANLSKKEVGYLQKQFLDMKSFNGLDNQLPSRVDLTMNQVPVMDQGIHGTCATFSLIAAIDALKGEGDYYSALCLLNLGKTLEKYGFNESGWNGTLATLLLGRALEFGLVPKQIENTKGCGGVYQYPTHFMDQSSAMKIEDYHQISEDLNKSIFVRSKVILSANQKFSERFKAEKVLNQTRMALHRGHRVLVSIIAPFDLTMGLHGKNHAPYDSWVLSDDLSQQLLSNALWLESFYWHAMLITGYDDHEKIIDFNGNQHIGAFKIRNSWGEHAGDSGEFYISYDFFQSLVVRLTEVM